MVVGVEDMLYAYWQYIDSIILVLASERLVSCMCSGHQYRYHGYLHESGMLWLAGGRWKEPKWLFLLLYCLPQVEYGGWSITKPSKKKPKKGRSTLDAFYDDGKPYHRQDESVASFIAWSFIDLVFLDKPNISEAGLHVHKCKGNNFGKVDSLCWLKDLLPKKCVGCRLFTLCSLFVCLFV